MKISGIKITKTATGKVKEVTFDYKKFSEYIDDLMDIISAQNILKHDKIRTPLSSIIKKEK